MNDSYLAEFEAPNRLLLGAGPCTVHPRVLRAMTQPLIGHLDPMFFQVMDEVCEMLRQVFHTENYMTVPISSTGTGAMETACANVLERGDTAIVCRNGYFGVRLADIAERCGANTIMVDSPWGQPADLNGLEDALNANPNTRVVGLVHAETSTGALSPLQEAIDLAHRHGAMVVVDAVTSLGSHEVRGSMTGTSTFATAPVKSAWERLRAWLPSRSASGRCGSLMNAPARFRAFTST